LTTLFVKLLPAIAVAVDKEGVGLGHDSLGCGLRGCGGLQAAQEIRLAAPPELPG
jgi:hypothetical protein